MPRWSGNVEAQRQADAAWNAVKHKHNRKKAPPKKKTLHPCDYYWYINSRHWTRKRKSALRFYGARCSICRINDVVLHVHHKTYARLGRERMSDLQVMCHDCHLQQHDIPQDSLSLEFRSVIGPR